MNTHDGSKGSKEQEYLSKKVLVNGQFVTLYSINGQTWLSSPEEIPELMARLENARIMLTNPEKPEGEAQSTKPAKPQAAEAPAPKVIQNKYRMKGPKPRPILKQGGVVIKGTPIEPISASNTVVSFSHDQEMSEEKARGSKGARVDTAKTKSSGKAAGAPKHIAPVLSAAGKSKKQAVPEKVAPKVVNAKSAAAAKSKEVAAASKSKQSVKVDPSVRPTAHKKAAVSKKSAAPERKAGAAHKTAKSVAKTPAKAASKASPKASPKATVQKAKPTSSKKKSSR